MMMFHACRVSSADHWSWLLPRLLHAKAHMQQLHDAWCLTRLQSFPLGWWC
jgi:hypothetical protein